METVLMDFLTNIGRDILIAGVSSFVFWKLTQWYSNPKTNIIFSDQIQKGVIEENGKKKSKYRIRFSNIGKRDLVEVSLAAKLVNKIDNATWEATYLRMGDGITVPVILGFQPKSDRHYRAYMYGIYMSSSALETYRREDIYPVEIIEKAKDGSLTPDDIFLYYKNDATLTIYAFGNDIATGARRMFYSKEYKFKDVISGQFCDFQKSIKQLPWWKCLPWNKTKNFRKLISNIDRDEGQKFSPLPSNLEGEAAAE